MIAVIRLKTHDSRSCRPHHAHAVQAAGGEPLAQDAGPGECLIQLLAPHQDVANGVERWIVHPTAKANFLFVETLIIVRRRKLNSVVIREVCLQNDSSWNITAAGAACNLRQELKGAFGGTEVGKAERSIRSDHANQCHVRNVVALCDHLRADEQIDLTNLQCAQHPLQIGAPAHCVAIEPRNSGLWKHGVQKVFQFFRPCAHILYKFTAALGACLRCRLQVTAVVAYEPMLELVIGHGDRAVLALNCLATFAA